MSPHSIHSPGTTGSGLPILQPETFALLTRTLDEAVKLDPTLVLSCNTLLTPLKLLDAMAREAEGALGDDVLAAERLRLLISLAEAHAPPSSMVRSMLVTTSPATDTLLNEPPVVLANVTAATFVPGATCQPALVHLGALVILGLAAGRVGQPFGLAEPMLNNVLGLALAAGPAEAVTRAIASGLSRDQLRAILISLVPHEGGNRSFSATVAAFLTDACERARWNCLDALFAQVRRDVVIVPWDAAGTGAMASVNPADGCGGEVITLQLNLNAPAPPSGLDAGYFLPRLARKEASVVFAAPGHASVARKAHQVDTAAGTVQVRVPAKVHGGWIGFSDEASVAKSNTARQALRAQWQARNDSGCLSSAPVPTQAIRDLPDPPSPPRSPGNQFSGGLPFIAEVSLTPDVVDIGGMLELRWRVAGAKDVTIEPEGGTQSASGSLTLVARSDQVSIERVVVAINRCGQSTRARAMARVRGRIDRLTIGQGGRPAPLVAGQPVELSATISPPDHPGPAVITAGNWTQSVEPASGQLSLVIPEEVGVEGLAGTLRLLGPDDTLDDERPFGPLRFVAEERRTVVLLRPAVIGRSFRRVSAAAAHSAVHSPRARGQQVDLVEPAWTEDEDLTCMAEPDGAAVPETLRLLERLNLLAARNPGLEEALWLALVPTPASGKGFHIVRPADGTGAVGVATPDRLPEALAEPLPELGPRTARLRIIGSVGSDLSVRVESMRVEERAAGPGAPLTTDLSVFGLKGGSIRFVQPLCVMSRARPAQIVALLPVTPEMDGIAIARNEYDGADDHLVLRRVSRPAGEPEVHGAALEGDTLSWEYSHSRSARSRFSIEVGCNGTWSPIAVVGPCAAAHQLPWSWIAPAARPDRVRIVASDGWNTNVTRALRLPPDLPQRRALARSAGPGRFWADLDFDDDELDPASIVWTLSAAERKTGPLLVLPKGYAGPVRLSVNGPEGSLSDSRSVNPDGTTDDRHLRWAQDVSRA